MAAKDWLEFSLELANESGPRNVAAGDPARHRDMLRLIDKCSAADLKS